MPEVLTSLSDALAETVAKVGPGVVRVDARDRLPASGIVWSRDGVVVTAHHVVERDDNISLGLPNGETVAAELVGRDPTTDLAVLRAQATDVTPPAFADPDSLRVGHLMLALGRPGESVRATMGIVSALGGSWRTPNGGSLDRYLQTDLVMYPGFSGGPLVDSAGQVLGLNTSSLLRGISLAVPTPTLNRVVEALLAHGRIRRGYLGVGAQPTQLPEGLAQQLGQETGLLLVSVESGSPAERGKLFLGDTIVAMDDQPVRQMDDLLAQLGGDRVGAEIVIRIVRGGQFQNLSVTLSEHP